MAIKRVRGVIMSDKHFINDLIQKSKVAQREYSVFKQKEVDTIVKAIGKSVFSRAEELAQMVVERSGMGDYQDKIAKCIGKSTNIWNSLKGKKSVDIIGEDKEKGLILLAKPIGIIGMVIPCTNPVVTPMCNLMFALQGREFGYYRPSPPRQNVPDTSLIYLMMPSKNSVHLII